jgi:hypothetical protein
MTKEKGKFSLKTLKVNLKNAIVNPVVSLQLKEGLKVARQPIRLLSRGLSATQLLKSTASVKSTKKPVSARELLVRMEVMRLSRGKAKLSVSDRLKLQTQVEQSLPAIEKRVAENSGKRNEAWIKNYMKKHNVSEKDARKQLQIRRLLRGPINFTDISEAKYLAVIKAIYSKAYAMHKRFLALGVKEASEDVVRLAKKVGLVGLLKKYDLYEDKKEAKSTVIGEKKETTAAKKALKKLNRVNKIKKQAEEIRVLKEQLGIPVKEKKTSTKKAKVSKEVKKDIKK